MPKLEDNSFPIYQRQNREWVVKALGEGALPKYANPGLVFEKYPRMWWIKKKGGAYLHDTWGTTGIRFNERKKRDEDVHLGRGFVDAFSREFGSQKSERVAALLDINCRLAKICTLKSGVATVLATSWRFVTGMGAPHPLENGFTFDRSAGVPYLPGTSVKGVARAGGELFGTEGGDTITAEDIERIFGPDLSGDGEEKALHVGSVVFMDAYPVEWPNLEPDVMTPHFGDYYTKDQPPSDGLQPNPIPFLTVAPNTKFRFILLPRNEATTKDDLEMAEHCLRAGLRELGAGAKTAAGYGYFE